MIALSFTRLKQRIQAHDTIGLLRSASCYIWLADICLNEMLECLFLGQDSADQDKYYRLSKGIALVWLIKKLVYVYFCQTSNYISLQTSVLTDTSPTI